MLFRSTVVYTQTIEADTQEEADAIALEKDVNAEGVEGDYSGWEEDGYAD